MRFFFVFAIASIILLIFYPSTNAKPFLDNKFDQKFDNKRVSNNIKQQMEGNGQQHVVVHKRSIDFLDKKFEQKFDNQRVWNHNTQHMEGNGQQIISTNDRPWLNNNGRGHFVNGTSTNRQSNSGQQERQFVSTSSNQANSDKDFNPVNSDITNGGRSRLSSSPSYSIQITNGKYIISMNNGDCIYKPGKIIENDEIRAMTDAEMQKIQSFLNGQINVPCFCAKC